MLRIISNGYIKEATYVVSMRYKNTYLLTGQDLYFTNVSFPINTIQYMEKQLLFFPLFSLFICLNLILFFSQNKEGCIPYPQTSRFFSTRKHSVLPYPLERSHGLRSFGLSSPSLSTSDNSASSSFVALKGLVCFLILGVSITRLFCKISSKPYQKNSWKFFCKQLALVQKGTTSV